MYIFLFQNSRVIFNQNLALQQNKAQSFLKDVSVLWSGSSFDSAQDEVPYSTREGIKSGGYREM